MSEKMPLGERPEPEFNKISPQGKERALAIVKAHFGSHNASLVAGIREALEQYEVEKTETDIRTIELANQLTNEMLSEFGLPQFDIPLENVHIIQLPEGVDSDEHGYYNADAMGIAVFRSKNSPLRQAQIILHEMIHAKHFLLLGEVRVAKDLPFRRLQGGLQQVQQTRRNPEARISRFSGLDEAVTSAIERRLYKSLLKKHEGFFADVREHYSRAALIKKEKKVEGTSYYPQDVIQAGDGEDDLVLHTYSNQYDFLDHLSSEIGKATRQDKEEVMRTFIRVYFTGEVKLIEAMVDEVWGPGAFELLGKMRSLGDSRKAAKRALERMEKNKKEKYGNPD